MSSYRSKIGSFALVFVIVATAVLLALVSYGYSVSTAKEISEIAANDVRLKARVEGFHLANLLQNEIEVIDISVRTAARSPFITGGEVEGGALMLNERQFSTAHITDRYFWLDEKGKTVWSSGFVNQTELALYKGFDASDRTYFVNAARTGTPYFSPITASLDGSQRLFISYPIIADSGERAAESEVPDAADSTAEGSSLFRGVIVGSIRADTLGSVVKEQLSPEIESTHGIIDPNGIIVYAGNASLIGQSVLGDEVQSILASTFSSQEELEEFNDFLKRSLDGGTESRDFSSNGRTSTVSYHPILLGSDEGGNDDPFLVLYLTAPHNVASVVSPLVVQQSNLATAVIATTGIVAAIIGFFVISWNKRLANAVEVKTATLGIANEALSKSNKELATRTLELAESNRLLMEANEQLTAVDKMQKEFINIAAHELRTPIQAILGYAEVLGSDTLNASPEDYTAISRNAKRLQRLTEDILDVSRIESGSLRLRKEQFPIDEVVIQAIEDAKNQAGDGKVKFKYEPSGITLEGDKDRIQQVVSNLMNNAAKFTKEGSITASAMAIGENGDSKMLLEISDTGTGIDPEILPRLFHKFATKSEKGTGLGLFIAKSIAEAHGGTITAKNNENAKGATFILKLPLRGHRSSL